MHDLEFLIDEAELAVARGGPAEAQQLLERAYAASRASSEDPVVLPNESQLSDAEQNLIKRPQDPAAWWRAGHLSLLMSDLSSARDAFGRSIEITRMKPARQCESELDLALVSAINSAYTRMKRDAGRAPDQYQTGEMWAEIINDKADFYSGALSADLSSARQAFSGFFRTSAICGLWEGGVFDRYASSLDWRRHFRAATIRNYRYWDVLTAESPEVVEFPDVGSPWGCSIGGARVSTAQFKLHYHANQILRLVSDKPRAVVLEIGGGFGGIGYFLFQGGFKGTYINLDLPETLVLSQYFLPRSFPNRSVLFYDEEHRDLSSMLEFDIVCLPNYSLPEIPSAAVDLVVNTRSLSEMPPATLREYFAQISRIGPRYLYMDNANQSSHHFEIRADEFGIPDEFRLLIKAKSLWYNGPPPNRFVEYLYERVHRDRSTG